MAMEQGKLPMTADDLTLGERLMICRSRSGLNQTELAEKVGLTRASLGRYESDMRIPSAVVLGKLAAYFGVTSDWLLGLRGTRVPGMRSTPANVTFTLVSNDAPKLTAPRSPLMVSLT